MPDARFSFLPENYLAGKQNRRTNILCGSLLAAILAAVGSAYAISEATVHAAGSRHAEVAARYAAAAQRLQQFKQMQKQQETLSRQAELSSSLIDRQKRSDVLAELTRRLPADAWLSDLELVTRKATAEAKPKTAFDKKAAKSKAAPPPPPVEKFDVVVRIIGSAKDDAQVAQILSALKESPRFADVNLLLSAADTRSNAPDAGTRFTAEVSLAAAAPVLVTEARP
jgi:Tfp pilus assembly protein PilN